MKKSKIYIHSKTARKSCIKKFENMAVFYEKLDTNQNASNKLKKQEGSYFDTDFSYGLLLDKRDRRYQTTDGYLSKFNQRVPLLSKDYALYNSY